MTAMNAQLEAALLASLENSEHGWVVVSAVTHVIPAAAGLTLNTGGLDPQTVTGPGTPEKVHITYQLSSEILNLTIIMMAELEDDEFTEMSVYYRGSSFTTNDASIHDQVASMAAPEIETQQSAFEALLKQIFAGPVSIQSNATLLATGEVSV